MDKTGECVLFKKCECYNIFLLLCPHALTAATFIYCYPSRIHCKGSHYTRYQESITQEYATVIMPACVARCLHYVTCLHHALKACIQTLNFSHEPIRFCSIRSSTYTISEFWRVNSSSVRKFISNWRESAVFDFPQCADCS